tara:strand:- start:419 stop:1270 length:852 start_codon:yes stop_codon:yes gene_type:complete
MPSYRIPNQSAYPLPQNASWWKGNANGKWKMNDMHRARAGDEWPPTTIPPPNYADGYFHRYINQGHHYSPNWLTYNDTWVNQTNLRNQHSIVSGWFNAVRFRCTTHDWTLQGIQHGNKTSSGSQTLYYRIGVWEGNDVNILTGSGLMEDTGSVSHVMNGQGWPYNSSDFLLTGAGGATDGTAVLTQNTWYTVAILYEQSWSGTYCAYSYSGDTGGYYYPGTQQYGTGTLTATNAGGTTTLYPYFEMDAYGTYGQGNGWPTLSGNWQSSGTSGPISSIKIKVWQ